MRRRLLVVMAFSLSLGCSKRGVPAKDAAHDAGVIEVDRGPPPDFDVQIENKGGSGAVFVFRFPDRPAVWVRLSRLSLGKVGDPDADCDLSPIDFGGEWLGRTWIMGTVPPNYRAEGCKVKTLSPGDYELVVFTQRGESRRKFHVAGDGTVYVRPWEDPPDWRSEGRR